MKIKKFNLFVLILLCSVNISLVAGQMNVQKTLSSLVSESNLIVRGYVSSIVSYERENGIIYSDIKFVLSEVFKGKFSVGRIIEFTYLGGTIGEFTTFVPELPQFVNGEECILFIGKYLSTKDNTDGYEIVNGGQGKFNIELNDEENKIVKRDYLIDNDLILDDNQTAKYLSNDNPLLLSEFKSIINSFITNGE